MSSKIHDPASAGNLAAFSTGLTKKSRGVTNEALSQFEEALKTGGVNARIPIIERAVESTRAGTAAGIRDTIDTFAKAGLSGTPFATGKIADVKSQGALATSSVMSDIINQLVQAAPNYGLQGMQVGLGGLGSAAQITLQKEMANQAAFMQSMQLLQDSVKSVTSTAGAAAAACLPENRTHILTSDGWTSIERLGIGCRVLTKAEDGTKITGTIVGVSRLPVVGDHTFVSIHTRGGAALASPSHPIDGATMEQIDTGMVVPGEHEPVEVLVVERWAARSIGCTHTRDILVDGPTGLYCVWPGVWMQSTLDRRHWRGI